MKYILNKIMCGCSGGSRGRGAWGGLGRAIGPPQTLKLVPPIAPQNEDAPYTKCLSYSQIMTF